mmetsp:Transcript_175129/g.561641  ORF Transcript_175129/g.561641 Transcript_175129/m.561641 type:complete len:313 (-) Transcript_175129:511-1449(-)
MRRSTGWAKVLSVCVDVGSRLPILGRPVELRAIVHVEDRVDVLGPLLLHPLLVLKHRRERSTWHWLVQRHHEATLVGVRAHHDSLHGSNEALRGQHLGRGRELDAVDDRREVARLRHNLDSVLETWKARPVGHRQAAEARHDLGPLLVVRAGRIQAAGTSSEVPKRILRIRLHGVVVEWPRLHDGAAKEPEAPGRHHVHGDHRGPAALAEDRDALGIAAQRADVALHPAQGLAGVLQREVALAGVPTALGHGSASKIAEGAQPVVHSHVDGASALFHEVVGGELGAAATSEAAAVYPKHHGKQLVVRHRCSC